MPRHPIPEPAATRRGLTHFVAALSLGSALFSGCGADPEEVAAQAYADASDAYAAGEAREAEIHLKTALRVQPKNVEARALLGKLYVDAGLGEAARTKLEQAMSANPNAPGVAVDLARAYILEGRYADAIALYAFGRPRFVVDAYARRLFGRLGLIAGDEPAVVVA